MKPTVFVNVKNDMTIAREEIFGPVLCVIAYENEEDAIRIANDSSYRLARLRERGGHPTGAACGLSNPRRPRGDQRHAGRSQAPSVDSRTQASAANSGRTGSRRFSNRGPFSNDPPFMTGRIGQGDQPHEQIRCLNRRRSQVPRSAWRRVGLW